MREGGLVEFVVFRRSNDLRRSLGGEGNVFRSPRLFMRVEPPVLKTWESSLKDLLLFGK